MALSSGEGAHRGGAELIVYHAGGAGSMALPPRSYNVTASRGFEYEIDAQQLSLTDGASKALSFSLKRSASWRAMAMIAPMASGQVAAASSPPLAGAQGTGSLPWRRWSCRPCRGFRVGIPHIQEIVNTVSPREIPAVWTESRILASDLVP